MANILESPLIIAIVVVAALIIICLIIYFLKQLSDNNSRISELENVNATNVKEITDWKEQKKNLPGITAAIQDIAKHTNSLIQANSINNTEKKYIKKSLKNIQDSLAEKEIFFKMAGEKKETKKSKKGKKDTKRGKKGRKDKVYDTDSSDEDSDNSNSSDSDSEDDMASDILKELDKKKK